MNCMNYSILPMFERDSNALSIVLCVCHYYYYQVKKVSFSASTRLSYHSQTIHI